MGRLLNMTCAAQKPHVVIWISKRNKLYIIFWIDIIYICITAQFCVIDLDPCAMVTCTTGFDAKSDVIDPLGICQCVCGTSLCDLSISNTCDSGVCKCGDAPQCDTTSTIPACLSSTGTTPVRGDSTATCKVGYISQSLHYPICYYCLNYDNLYIL